MLTSKIESLLHLGGKLDACKSQSTCWPSNRLPVRARLPFRRLRTTVSVYMHDFQDAHLYKEYRIWSKICPYQYLPKQRPSQDCGRYSWVNDC